MNRRLFLESLTALTVGMLLPSSRQLEDGHDQHGDLLPRRILGRTGEAVTMLGVGGWHLGQMSPRDAQATVEAAIEGGIRFFDSAESYQAGGSESYLVYGCQSSKSLIHRRILSCFERCIWGTFG